MHAVRETIEVEVPIRTAFAVWTRFEEFPRFMTDVEEVQRLEDGRLRWRARVAGMPEEWEARVTESIPLERIAWTSTSGARNAGAVTFHEVEPNRTRVELELRYEPEGLVENLGDLLGIFERRVEQDLAEFKKYVESRAQRERED